MKFLLLAMLMAFLSGCATKNTSYWSATRDGQGAAQLPHEKDKNFFKRLRVIEFDEQGDYWNPKQVRAAQDMIDQCERPLVVTYIHGWQNNGRPTNGDLESFNKFLQKLEGEGIGKKRQVCGVFIAWRGEGVEPFLAPVNIPRHLTFWSRKSATDRVASIPLSRTLTLLCEETHRNNGNIILMGHSFGGRVLERTFGQWLAVEGTRKKEVESIADLVVLINPASESLYAYKLKQSLHKMPENARPVIVSITSKSDTATKNRWAEAANIRAFLKGGNEFRPYYRTKKHVQEDQQTFVNQTAGHDDRQWTHWLKEVPLREYLRPRSMFSWNVSHATKEYFFIRTKNGGHKAYALVPIPRDAGPAKVWQTSVGGYWVFQVEDDVLHEHGGITDTGGLFNPQMVDLLGAVVSMTKAKDAASPPTISLAPVDSVAPLGR